MTRLVPFRFSVGAIHELTLLSMTPPFLDMGDAERCGEGMREAKTGRGWSDLPYSLSSIEIDSHTRSSRPKRLLKYVILPSPQYCGVGLLADLCVAKYSTNHRFACDFAPRSQPRCARLGDGARNSTASYDTNGYTAHIYGIENFWNQAKRHPSRYNGVPQMSFRAVSEGARVAFRLEFATRILGGSVRVAPDQIVIYSSPLPFRPAAGFRPHE